MEGRVQGARRNLCLRTIQYKIRKNGSLPLPLLPQPLNLWGYRKAHPVSNVIGSTIPISQKEHLRGCRAVE